MKLNFKPHSVLAYSVFETVNDIVEANSNQEVQTGDVDFIDNQGNIYIPLRIPADPNNDNIPHFVDSDDKNNADFGRLRGDRCDFQDFRERYLSNDIMTLEFDSTQISLEVLLKELSANDDIYGCLLEANMDGNRFIINPLHPAIAFLIIGGLIKLPESGKLHVYSWCNSPRVNALKDRYSSAMAERWKNQYSKMFNLASKIIMNEQMVQHNPIISESDLEYISDRPLWQSIRSMNVTIEKRVISEGDRPEGIMVPLQIAADGIFTPYYGVAYVDDPSDSVRGFNASPMMTGNINASMSSPLARNRRNVCTGDESSSTKRGWLTLSRINLNSMYNNDIVALRNVYTFIKTSKDISHEIWATLVDQKLNKDQNETSEDVNITEVA